MLFTETKLCIMKNVRFYPKAILAFLFSLLLTNQPVQAQILQLPSTPDNIWFNLPYLTWGLTLLRLRIEVGGVVEHCFVLLLQARQVVGRWAITLFL